MKPQPVPLFSVVLVLALTLVGMPAAASANPPPLNDQSIFVVTLNNQSYADAILMLAGGDETYRRRAIALVTTWKQQVAAGHQLDLGQLSAGKSPAAISTELQQLRNGLESTVVTKAPQTSSGGVSATMAAQIDGSNPNSFPVRGYPGSGSTSWKGMQLIVAGRFCNSSGCGPDTDRVTCNVTVNPGADSSMISSNCLYFPDSGSFGDKHFQMWSINRGTITNWANTGDVTGSKINILSNGWRLRGTVLTVALTLWVYLNPAGKYTADGAKAADCTCHTYDNVCVY